MSYIGICLRDEQALCIISILAQFHSEYFSQLNLPCQAFSICGFTLPSLVMFCTSRPSTGWNAILPAKLGINRVILRGLRGNTADCSTLERTHNLLELWGHVVCVYLLLWCLLVSLYFPIGPGMKRWGLSLLDLLQPHRDRSIITKWLVISRGFPTH